MGLRNNRNTGVYCQANSNQLFLVPNLLTCMRHQKRNHWISCSMCFQEENAKITQLLRRQVSHLSATTIGQRKKVSQRIPPTPMVLEFPAAGYAICRRSKIWHVALRTNTPEKSSYQTKQQLRPVVKGNTAVAYFCTQIASLNATNTQKAPH